MVNRHVLQPAFLAGILLVVGSGTARAQDELLVANFNAGSVTVFARTANGNAVPLRTISQVPSPDGLAVDTLNNELAVANGAPFSSVQVYSRTANGAPGPLRTIVGASTGLTNPFFVAIDAVHNELVVSNVSPSPSIRIFSRTANGNVAPLRTISGAATGLTGPNGVVVDTVNDELVVANANNGSITVYARTANGNVAPLRTIIGAATGLAAPTGVAVDNVNNEIVVATASPFFPQSITVFSRTANGNVAPLRTIAGATTAFSAPWGVAVDTQNNEIAVANQNNDTVTVYSRTANGDVAPLRTLVGAATGLGAPAGVAITTGVVSGLNFYTVTQCRILDTRNPAGPWGGPSLSAGSSRSFVLAGGSAPCGIPATARAVAITVTALLPTAGPGFLTVYPGGSTLPPTSTINTRVGRIRANNAVLALGPAGDITVYCAQSSGTIDLFVDVVGYFQ